MAALTAVNTVATRVVASANQTSASAKPRAVAPIAKSSAFLGNAVVGKRAQKVMASRQSSVQVSNMASLYDFSKKALGTGTPDAPVDGAVVPLSTYAGKVVLIENVATLWGTTVRDFTQMNALAETFGDKLAVLGFPCNQFGHQTQESDQEVLNLLKYVRPGGGYEPNFPMFSKMDVNGTTEDDLWTFLKAEIPYPSDDKGGLGADHITDLWGSQPPLWAPLRRSDVTWNFEKFLVNQEGKPVKRYSPKFETADIAADIKALIEGGPNALS